MKCSQQEHTGNSVVASAIYGNQKDEFSLPGWIAPPAFSSMFGIKEPPRSEQMAGSEKVILIFGSMHKIHL